MTTYGLIHGAWGSGAGWRPFTEELEARGHRVVAPDLPIEEPEALFSDYARTVVAALGACDGDVVLVAHSMGGVTMPLVAAALPVREMVFVAALLPQPARPLAELWDEEPMVLPGATASVEQAGVVRRWTDAAAARERLFNDCDDALAREGFAAMRGQSVKPYFEPCPLDALPRVPRRYVVCAQDRVVNPEWGREAAPRLLGVEAVALDAGHTPQLSRPAELAGVVGA